MSDMRYEPGNWGDILKGLWVESIVRERASMAGPTYRICDSFAGHPVYPLTTGTRARLDELSPDDPFLATQKAYVPENLLASAATIMRDTMRLHHKGEHEISAFDLDLQKREHYQNFGGFDVLEIEDGFEALDQDRPEYYDLIVLDPYEFIWRYEELLPRVLAASQHCDILMYIFNKAPGSGGNRRNYTNFLNDLDCARPEGDYLAGRVPSDGFLPQIYHEMLYLPRRGPEDLSALGSELRERTCKLADHILSAHLHTRGRL